MPVLSDVTRARLLDSNQNPLTEWHAVYNLKPELSGGNSLFFVDLAVAARNDNFGAVITTRDPFSNMMLLVQRAGDNHHNYYLFKNCIFQSFNALDIAEGVWYGETTFYCQFYEIHTGNRLQIIRPIRSQQSRTQANPDTGIRNRLEDLGRNPDCGRDSDGPVDWLNNGF